MTALPRPILAPLTVEELRDRGAIGALGAEWERLRAEVAAQGGVHGPFLSSSWFAVYAAHLAREPRALKLLVAHRAGRVCGILPLLVERRSLSGLPARVLRSLSDDHSQRFDALVDGDEAARALFAHLARDREWDALELRDAPEPDQPNARPTGVARICAAAEAANFPTARWASMVSPYLPLPSSPAALDGALSSKFRGNLRRRARKLAADVGPVELERVTDRAALDAALDEGFRLEAAGWKGERGTAIACDPELRARYRALGRAAGARLALYFLRAGGIRRAFHFGMIDGGVYFLFKPGFDPQLAEYGLGHLLIDYVARDLIAQGVRELDFLGDDMPWKREWTSRARRHAWRYVFRPSAYGRALHAWKFRVAPAMRRLGARLRRASTP